MKTVDPKALEKLIRESGVSFRQNAASYKFTCPRCNKPEKLWMLKTTGQFVCFYCAEIDGFKGSPEYALRELLDRPLHELQHELYGTAYLDADTGLELNLKDFFGDEESDDIIDVQKEEPLLEIGWPVDSIHVSLSVEAMAYLVKRGIPLQVCNRYNIRYWPAKKRILFPVVMHGKLVGYQGRTILDVTEFLGDDGSVKRIPKILSSDKMPRERTLMFHDNLIGSPHAVLCEGPVDALKADLCGGNVAAMGKAVTRTQLKLIIDSGVKRLYLALDPDAAKEVKRIAMDMSDKIEVYLLNTPKGRKDLGEATCEEVLEEFKKAMPFNAGKLLLYFKSHARFA